MKYFTPERYLGLQNCSSASAMDSADTEWEKAVGQYDAYLREILPGLPPSVRRLADMYLHDADVLSMSREGDNFMIQLQPEVPPHDLITFSFSLTGEPDVNRSTLPPEQCSEQPQWLHEELEVVDSTGETHYRLSVLLSNGWEVRLPFRDVQITFAQSFFPVVGAAAAAQSA
jgi:hypothetical protein